MQLSLYIALALAILPVSAGAAGKDACSLLTAADAEAALGEVVAAPQAQVISPGGDGLAAVSSCRFKPVHSAIGKSVSLMARFSPTPNPADADSVRSSLERMGQPKEIRGVGDKALWVFHKTGPITSGQLNVFSKGTIYLIFTVDGLADDSAALEKTKALAQKVLSRL
jgi:hypothetical protein